MGMKQKNLMDLINQMSSAISHDVDFIKRACDIILAQVYPMIEEMSSTNSFAKLSLKRFMLQLPNYGVDVEDELNRLIFNAIPFENDFSSQKNYLNWLPSHLIRCIVDELNDKIPVPLIFQSKNVSSNVLCRDMRIVLCVDEKRYISAAKNCMNMRELNETYRINDDGLR